MNEPVFVMSSGRSGTFQLANLLKSSGEVDVEHERLFEPLLSVGVESYSGINFSNRYEDVLAEYTDSVNRSLASSWVDISNALPWVASDLHARFPRAKFINLVRDGRKVVLSFYNKFQTDMYASECVNALQGYIDGILARPPEEKKYWRPLPPKGYAEQFSADVRFVNLCWYWRELTAVSDAFMSTLNPTMGVTIRFEDLIASQTSIKEFVEFIGIDPSTVDMNILKKPQNVAVPKNFEFKDAQLEVFDEICGAQQKKFGYDSREIYRVKY